MATRYFDVGAFHFGVRTTSAAFGVWLDYALDAYRVQRPARIRYSVVVASGRPSPLGARGLNILYRGTTSLARSLELGAVAGAFLADIETLLLPQRDDFVYLRAARVAAGDVTALVPASLSLGSVRHERRAARMGLAFSPSTAVAVDLSSARLCPITPQLAVPGDAVARLAPAPGDDGPRSSGGVVNAVVTVAAPDDVPPEGFIAPVSRAATLCRMAPWLLNLPPLGSETFDVLGRVVAGARCFAIRSSGDVVRMLEALASEFQRDRASRE